MPKRNRAWADVRFAGVDLVAGTAKKFDLLVDAPTVDTLTAVRVILDLTMIYDVTTTIGDALSVVDCGIGVASKEAFDAGVASLPDVIDSKAYPPRGWLYVATLPVAQLVTTDAGIINEIARFIFDGHSMRKIDKGILFLLCEQNNIDIGGVMKITGRTRVLCLT